MAKKALICGINSYITSPLRGCVNDVQDIYGVLTSIGKYPPDNVRAVCDERATTQGIRDRMAWLREGITGPGDEVFFSFSGHGSQVRDRGVQDELSDYLDEIIVPVDIDWNTKLITDDDIGGWLKMFPSGTRIIVVLDCCHSGTSTRSFGPPQENPHYRADRFLAPPIDIALRANGLSASKDSVKKTRIGHGAGLRWNWRKARAKGKSIFSWCGGKPKSAPVPEMNHVLISGCRSDQTSADAFIDGRYNGALTYYLVRAIKQSGSAPLSQVHMVAKQSILAAGFSQEPQLEGPEVLINGPMFA